MYCEGLTVLPYPESFIESLGHVDKTKWTTRTTTKPPNVEWSHFFIAPVCVSRRLPRVSCVKWGPLWLGIFFTVVFLFCYTSLSPRLICFYVKIGTQRGLSVWLHEKLTANVLETFQNALEIILGESVKWLGSRKPPVRILRPSSASVRNERSCCLLSCMIFAIIFCVYILSDFFSNSLSIFRDTDGICI